MDKEILLCVTTTPYGLRRTVAPTETPGEQRARRKRMKNAVDYLQHYMATYTQQSGYQDYSDSILIDDVLYGLGVALGEEYKFATGFAKFKDRLREHLRVAPTE